MMKGLGLPGPCPCLGPVQCLMKARIWVINYSFPFLRLWKEVPVRSQRSPAYFRVKWSANESKLAKAAMVLRINREVLTDRCPVYKNPRHLLLHPCLQWYQLSRVFQVNPQLLETCVKEYSLFCKKTCSAFFSVDAVGKNNQQLPPTMMPAYPKGLK